MEHFNTLQKKESQPADRSRWRFWCMMLLAVLLGTSGMYGQNPGWDTSQTKLVLKAGVTKLTIGLENLGEDYLDLYLNPADNLSDIMIVISDPGGFTATSAPVVSVGGSLLSENNGYTYQYTNKNHLIKFDALASGVEVHISQNISAKDCTTPYDLTKAYEIKAWVQPSSNTADENFVVGTVQSFDVDLQEPTIQAQFSASGTWNMNESKQMSYTFSVADGEIEEVSFVFVTDQYTTLSNFQIGANTFVVTPVETSASKTYTVTLDKSATSMNGRLGTTAKTLTMEANVVRCGLHEIKSGAKYLCDNKNTTLPQYNISINGESLKPNMKHISSRYIKGVDEYSSSYYLDFDNVNTIRSIFENTSTADGYGLRIYIGNYGEYSTINSADAYYTIKDNAGNVVNDSKGAPMQNIHFTDITNSGGYTAGYKANYGYLTTPPADFGYRSFYGTIEDTHFIPAGGKIEVYAPIRVGNGLYDDTRTEDLFFDYHATTLGGIVANISTITNACGDIGTFDRANSRLSYLSIPHFREKPTGISLDGTPTTKKVYIRMATGALHNTLSKLELQIKTPDWILVKGAKIVSLNKAEYANGTGTLTGSNGNYTATFQSPDNSNSVNSNCYLEVEIETNPSGITTNKEENIQYSMDFRLLDSNTVLKNIYRVNQPANLLVEKKGISLDRYYLHRETRGYKDTGVDGDADNTTLADYDDIRNEMYMTHDEGTMIWEGTIHGTGFTHLYFPVETAGLDANQINFKFGPGEHLSVTESAAKLSIGGVDATGATASVAYSSDNKQMYLLFKMATAFADGASIKAELPFKALKAYNFKNFLVSKGFVSSMDLVNPFVDPIPTDGREGKDIRYTDITVLSEDPLFHWDENVHTFTDNNSHTIGTIYWDTFHDGKFTSPWFNNEVRYIAWPNTMNITMPEGYVLEKLIVKKATRSGNTSTETKDLPPNPLGNNKYSFDVKSLYDTDYPDKNPSLASGKWERPDDRFVQYIQLVVRAEKWAVRAAPTAMSVSLDLYTGGSRTVTCSAATFQYTGPALTLSTPTTVSASDKEIVITDIEVKNPNTTAIDDIWLYIDGDIENLSIKDGASATTPTSKWIKISNSLATNGSVKANLSMTYTGSFLSSPAVTIYAFSGYGSGFTPDESKSYTDYENNNGAFKVVNLLTPKASLTGSLTVNDGSGNIPVLTYQGSYTVKATLSAEASQASVLNPSMIIEVPIGQKITGATLAYGSSTPVDFATLTTRLADLNINSDNGGSFVFDLAKALGLSEVSFPGSNSSSTDPKTATLTMTYEAVCKTSQGLTRFMGTLNGSSSLSGVTVAGNGKEVRSAIMQPADDTPYKFNVSVSGQQAFSPVTHTGVLSITLDLSRITAPIESGNIVKVALPESLRLDGSETASWNSDKNYTLGTLSVTEYDSSTPWILKLPIPEGAFNADNTEKITYNIPVTYTEPTGADKDALALNPVDGMMVEAITMVEPFGGTNCDPLATKVERTIGYIEYPIAFVVADLDLPFAVFVGESKNIEITSDGFDGTLSATNGTQSGSSLTITPVAASYPDATAFETENGKKTEKVTVAISISGTSYGTVELPYVVYPSLDFSLNATAQKTFCDTDVAKNVTDLVGTFIQTGYSKWIDVNFYESSDASFATPVPAKDFPIGSTTLKAVATHKTETTIRSAIPLDLTVAVNTSVGAGLAVDKTSAIVPEVITLTASGAKSSGDGSYYQFYKGTTPLDGPTQTVTKTYTTTTADVAASPLSFTVQVVNSDGSQDRLCGTLESTAVSVTVTDRPADIAISSTGETIYSCDATANLNLAGLIDNFASYTNSETFHWNTTGNTADGTSTFTTTISLAASVGAGTSQTIYVWAYNGTNYSAAAASVPVTAIQYTGTSLANISELVLEAAAGMNATATIIATASGSVDPVTSKYSYTLYDSGNGVVDGPTGNAGSNTFTGQSVAAPALNYTTADHLAYTFKVSAIGACGPAAEKSVSVKVYPTPVVELKAAAVLDREFCGTTAMPITLWDYLVDPNTTLFDYEYSENGSSYSALTNSTTVSVPASGIAKTVNLRAKNKMATPSVSTVMDLILVVNVPVEAVTFAPAVIDLEGATSTTITVPVPATGTKDGGNNFNYILYKTDNSVAGVSQTGNLFTGISLAAPLATESYNTASYYATVQGATTCTAIQSTNNVTVNVYPVPTIAASSLASVTNYCETDPTLVGGIDLWDYIDSPNKYWFTYSYSTDGGSTYTDFVDGDVTIPVSVGTHSYVLKAVNKLSGSTQFATIPVSVKVEKKTTILGVTGYEVTEGQAINIVVSADGEGTLSYDWYEGNSLVPLATTNVNTYQITPSANISANNGKVYRVVVRGTGICSQAEQSFTLNVKSAVTPPLGNYRVSWTVIGYGKIEVKADGISISNGSHVNKGAKLEISATTWMSNALDKVTVNGTEYSSSPVSYTVGEENVNIVAEFNGSDPNPDPNSNADIENSTRIWTEGGYACIYTETATRARIVTFNGRLVTDQKLSEGETRIQLPDGYYIVTLSDGTTKKIAIRNF